MQSCVGEVMQVEVKESYVHNKVYNKYLGLPDIKISNRKNVNHNTWSSQISDYYYSLIKFIECLQNGENFEQIHSFIHVNVNSGIDVKTTSIKITK